MTSKSIKITVDQVRHLAKLANLKLNEKQIKNIIPALTSVLKFVSKIQSLSTKNIEETSQVTGQENVYRQDIIDDKRMLSQEEALKNTKKKYKGYFLIDAIFD